MSLIGLYCENNELLLAIETAFNIARLKNTNSGTCEIYPLQNLSMLTEVWIIQQEQISFLICLVCVILYMNHNFVAITFQIQNFF